MSEFTIKKEFTIQNGKLNNFVHIKVNPQKFAYENRKITIEALEDSTPSIQKYKRKILTVPDIPTLLVPFVKIHEYIIDELITVTPTSCYCILKTTNGIKFNFIEEFTCDQDGDILKCIFITKVTNKIFKPFRKMALNQYLNSRLLELKNELDFTVSMNPAESNFNLLVENINNKEINSFENCDFYEEIEDEDEDKNSPTEEENDGYDYDDIPQ